MRHLEAGVPKVLQMPQLSLCYIISRCQYTYFKYAIFYNETCAILFQMSNNN